MSDRSRDTCENYTRPPKYSAALGDVHLAWVANQLHFENELLKQRIGVLEGTRVSLQNEINRREK